MKCDLHGARPRDAFVGSLLSESTGQRPRPSAIAWGSRAPDRAPTAWRASAAGGADDHPPEAERAHERTDAPLVGPSGVSGRVLLYSHDSFGLGHLRRSLLLAERIVARPEVEHALVVTGSPRCQTFRVADGIDTVKLPAITKDDRGSYRTRTLGLPLEETLRLRADLIGAALESFAPDVVVVDHAPIGLAGELLPVFARLDRRASRPRLLLGLREIIDAPERVAADWDRDGVWDVLRHRYDRILVYGDPTVRSTAQELDLDARIGRPVIPVGYVAGSTRRADAGVGPTTPTVLVTGGGGGDSHHLLRAYVAYLERYGPDLPFRSVIVTGPMMSPRRRTDLEERFRATGAPGEIVDFTEDHDALLARASAVISMAGYNSSCEIIASGLPALLVPREGPRAEQLLRASGLAERGAVRTARLEEATPERLAAFIDSALDGSFVPAPLELDLGGADATAEHVVDLLRATGAASGPGGRSRGVTRVGYVLKKFPRLSETFILNELLGLERLGLDVDVFSLHAADDEPRHAALQDLAAEVTVLSPTSSASTAALLMRLGEEAGDEAVARALRLLARLDSRQGERALAKGLELAAAVRDRGITHLHAHFLTGAAHAAHVAHLACGVPFTVTTHAKDLYRHDVDWEVFTEVAATAEAIVTVCEANRAHIERRLTRPGVRIEVIHNGLPLADLPPPSVQRERHLVLGVGRLVEKKGFDDLIDACRSLREAGTDVECVIVGGGEQRDTLEQRILAAGLEGLVRLAGPAPRETVLDLMGRARVLAMPSVTGADGNQDALPTVIIEAMAMGLPVVSTPVGGIPEMFGDGEEGLLVPQRDPTALAAALHRVLTDDDLWSDLAARAPRTAAERFDRERTIRQLVGVLVPGEGPLPGPERGA